METESIIKSLKERKVALTKELSNVEKALAALTPEAAPKKAPATSTKPSNPVREGMVKGTLEAVVRACEGEFCNAEKVALRLGADTTKVSALLSKAYAQGKLIREGVRGSYEYKSEPPGVLHVDATPITGSPFKATESAEV